MPFSKKRQEAKKEKGAPGAGTHKSSHQHARSVPVKSTYVEEIEQLRLRITIYRRIIERYREIIEKAETKTVTELRGLVVPKDAAVAKMREEILEEFRPYIYEEHFEQAVEKAYKYVRERIANEELPVDFWLAPEDVLELRAADEMDKAVLLCSLLRALECEDAKVVVESNGERHVFVGYEFKGTYTLMDPAHERVVRGAKQEVVEKEFGGRGKQVYEFNDKEYDEIIGGE